MSVAIASFQREASLERLLGSLADALRQPFAAGEARVAEVIVVLDGSTDGSRDLVERRQEGFPVPLRHLWQPNRGLAAARNAGRPAIVHLVTSAEDIAPGRTITGLRR